MSQYPSPYQPPTPPPYSPYDYYSGPKDMLAPAKRAGILMFVLAGVIILSSACCVGGGAMVPRAMAERPEAFRELEKFPDFTPERLRDMVVIAGVVGLVFGIVLAALGGFVRKGGKGSIITSIVLSSLAILLLLLWSVGGAMQGGPGACIFVIPLGLFVLLMVWLIQAVRASSSVLAIQAQYQQQYWQHAYQQQMYAQQQQQRPTGMVPPSASQVAPPPPPPPGGPDVPPPQG